MGIKTIEAEYSAEELARWADDGGRNVDDNRDVGTRAIVSNEPEAAVAREEKAA